MEAVEDVWGMEHMARVGRGEEEASECSGRGAEAHAAEASVSCMGAVAVGGGGAEEAEDEGRRGSVQDAAQEAVAGMGEVAAGGSTDEC